MFKPLRRTFMLALVLLVVGVALPSATRPEWSSAAEAQDAAARCGLLTPIRLPAIGDFPSRVACTHGSDPAPAGWDHRVPFDPDNLTDPRLQAGLLLPDPVTGPSTAPSGTPGVRCFGDGQSGERIQAVYARPADRPDRFNGVLPHIRKWAGEVDAVFAASAGKTGATRHVRYVTKDCKLDVERVVLSPVGDLDLATTMAEMAVMGYDRPDRKYLVWMDSTELCGIAAYYEDDSPGRDNLNNANPTAPGVVARIDSGCWGLYNQGESVEAHELMHMMGSVLKTAPHATLLGHCTDESDRMCYADGGTLAVDDICGTKGESVFDCDDDDYFHPSPAPGSYLASHWNTANSAFLSPLEGDVPVTISGGSLAEGDVGEQLLNFTVALESPVPQTVSMKYDTANGTAIGGADFTAVTGSLSFTPGETSKTIGVPILGDNDDENDEQFTLVLSEVADGELSGGPGVGTIVDDDPKGQGYWLVASDGGIFSFADARFFGSTGNIKLNQPIVGMAATPSGQGYWLVARDGGIFAFGDAKFYGSTGDIKLNQPIVGMATVANGGGYWLVAADGGVFAFGDAVSYGSAAGEPKSAPVVGMVPLPSGKGYWIATADGAVFSFGDAARFGAPPKPNQPVVGATGTPSGKGLWLVARDGGIFSLGDAAFFGSTGNIKLNKPIVGLSTTPSGAGYWLVATDGGIFSFGDAGFYGSTGNIALNQPINGMASVH